MVLRALPEAGCLMRLFATARYEVQRHVAALKRGHVRALQSYAWPPSRNRQLSLTQHFQQRECILRRGAFGVVVEVNVHIAVFL